MSSLNPHSNSSSAMLNLPKLKLKLNPKLRLRLNDRLPLRDNPRTSFKHRANKRPGEVSRI